VAGDHRGGNTIKHVGFGNQILFVLRGIDCHWIVAELLNLGNIQDCQAVKGKFIISFYDELLDVGLNFR